MRNPVESVAERLGRDTVAVPLLVIVVLLGIAVLRFVTATPGEELLAVIPIALLGMMFGVRGGLAAAVFAAAVFLAWALNHNISTLEDLDEPLTFFVLGAATGFFAHGSLGDYDLSRYRVRRRVRHAIEEGQIVMYYQPVVGASHGETVAVEALARWRLPDGQIVPPLSFIPAVEADPSSIRTFTLHTFELAATYATEQLAASSIRVAVNLSPAVLGSARIPGELGSILRRTGLEPERLYVEITETALAGGEAAVAETIGVIKRLGIGMVMLDDFGVGHSSLSRLSALDIDALKIDKELVLGLDRPQNEAVVRSIIELAHGLELTVVAEGVEDARTQTELRDLGCDAIQGFHLSPPLPGEELPSWLSREPAAAAG